MFEATGILLWIAIAAYGLVSLLLGWPFRRMRGIGQEIVSLGAVYLVLVGGTVLGLAAGGDANFSGDAKSIRSIAFGVVLALLWSARLFEWQFALRRRWLT